MHTIPLQNLLFMLLPVTIVGCFYYKWLGNVKEIAYATLRMSSQLLLIGYVLEFLFKDDSPIIGVAIVLFMIAVSSMIALRSCRQKSFQKYTHIFAAIAIGGSFNLLIVLIAVLDLKSLYTPMVMIPLAGMIYANAMNAVAIAVERFDYEIQLNDYIQSRFLAFKAAMIPQVNTLLAVGLVSLPGMMTGQILSGISPLIAARYQIVVMAMVLGSAGISTILFLYWQKVAISQSADIR
ncbi:MAG: ABC transporter permease [Thiovulaceae bacterium]|nr:ABC transporter permease [Sulfurimonadaceae bacterium]